MSREILFRAQHIKKGEKVNLKGEPVPGMWAYGGILQGPGDYSLIYSTEPEIAKWPVYTETVGQFTGMLDKNGTKIFEGDILHETFLQTDIVGDVRYNDGRFDFVFKRDGREIRDYLKCLACNHCIEVIGNIYDNPELLEAES